MEEREIMKSLTKKTKTISSALNEVITQQSTSADSIILHQLMLITANNYFTYIEKAEPENVTQLLEMREIITDMTELVPKDYKEL